MATISCARSVPGTSPMTFWVVASTSLFEASVNCRRSGLPPASTWD